MQHQFDDGRDDLSDLLSENESVHSANESFGKQKDSQRDDGEALEEILVVDDNYPFVPEIAIEIQILNGKLQLNNMAVGALLSHDHLP